MINDVDILKFQKLYIKYFGKKLDKETALKKLTALVNQVEAIYRPITQQQLNEYVYGNEDEYDRAERSTKKNQ